MFLTNPLAQYTIAIPLPAIMQSSMCFKFVYLKVRNRGDDSLGVVGVASSLQMSATLPWCITFSTKTHTNQSWSDDKEVVFMYNTTYDLYKIGAYPTHS